MSKAARPQCRTFGAWDKDGLRVHGFDCSMVYVRMEVTAEAGPCFSNHDEEKNRIVEIADTYAAGIGIESLLRYRKECYLLAQNQDINSGDDEDGVPKAFPRNRRWGRNSENSRP